MNVNIKAAEAVEVVSGFLDTLIDTIEKVQGALEELVENLEDNAVEEARGNFMSWLDEAYNFGKEEPVEETEREKNIAYMSRVWEYLVNKGAHVGLDNPWTNDVDLDDEYIQYAVDLVKKTEEYRDL